MDLLVLSDIHSSFSRVESILRHECAVDGIVICGDFTTRGTEAEVANALSVFRRAGVPIFAVAGNMDSPAIDSHLTETGSGINGIGRVFGDVGFFGVSASPPTLLHTPYEISEENILAKAETGWKDVQEARWKVLVTHTPPFQTKLDRILLGKHVGSRSIRSFVEHNQPDLVVCGHIHEARGVDTIGKTQIVNCGAAAQGLYARIHLAESMMVELCG